MLFVFVEIISYFCNILKSCDTMYKKVTLFQLHIVLVFSSLTIFGMGKGGEFLRTLQHFITF